MPSHSVAQQHLMGLAYAMKKGKRPRSGRAGQLASKMSITSLREYAETKTKHLPRHKKRKKRHH